MFIKIFTIVKNGSCKCPSNRKHMPRDEMKKPTECCFRVNDSGSLYNTETQGKHN